MNFYETRTCRRWAVAIPLVGGMIFLGTKAFPGRNDVVLLATRMFLASRWEGCYAPRMVTPPQNRQTKSVTKFPSRRGVLLGAPLPLMAPLLCLGILSERCLLAMSLQRRASCICSTDSARGESQERTQ